MRSIAREPSSRVVRLSESDAFTDGDKPVCVPDAEYSLRFIHHETAMMFQRAPKLICWFEILDQGEHFGKRLPRYYNVVRLLGKQGKSGKFKVGWRSDFMREYCTICAEPSRADRMALSELKRHMILGKTRTVCADSKQRNVPSFLRYSVVDQVLGVANP